MIIGLTGKNGAGKGEVARFLKERSFACLSLSDVLREELESRGKAVTRENLLRTGNELRALHGPSVLAERTLQRLEPDRNYVIDSIRHPAEAQTLKRRGDFMLLRVEASPRTRFERVLQRGRENDPSTYEEFVRLEGREASGPLPSDQSLDAACSLADRAVKNEGTLEELHRQVTEVVMELSRAVSRPDWDPYFMGIARVVSLRSNCVKRKVAAVLVKDRRIVSTGYNGTPRGVRNCSEGGCPRCNGMAPAGARLDTCLCSHAEENAITQAAYHGVNIKESVLYTTFTPCLQCAKMIINSGIVEVVYQREYTIENVPLNLLREAGVQVRQVNAPS